jgi:phage terminase small subunit
MSSAQSLQELDAAGLAGTEEVQLTERQRAFVAEYLIDLNGTQAAIRAGYAPNSAGEQAVRLLADARIAAAVERGKAARNARVGITADTVLSEMAALATSNIDHYVIDDDGNVVLAPGAPTGAMSAVQSVQKKIRKHYDKETGALTGIDYDVSLKLWDKPNPLKLMGKHVGIKAFFDKVEVTGPNGGPVQVERVVREVVDPQAEAGDV